ncbi:MAG: hypothetical protein K2Q03_02860, partial [Sphingobacteriaceae bacterium]|nr:hypothetical protein [Sphingobacteriaceae bacterium]
MKLKNTLFIAGSLFVVGLAACKKKEENVVNTITAKQVFVDFVNYVGKPNYNDFELKTLALKVAVTDLNANTNEANLVKAQQAWLATRAVWEQAEGWLWGPIADAEVDPKIDSWPTKTADLDAVIANNNLAVADIENLENSLKGFHPLEYILFGENKSRKASDLTTKQKLYLVSLTTHLTDLVVMVKNDFNTYANTEMLDVKASNKNFSSEYQGLFTIANGLAGIIGEVGDRDGGKMQDPINEFLNNKNEPGNYEESQYAMNTLTDFYHNVVGVQNVYLGQYGAVKGKGLSD